MAARGETLTLEAQVQAIMDELGVDAEAAALLAAVRNGVALVDDVVIEPGPEADERTAVVASTTEHEARSGAGRPALVRERGNDPA
jgi:hypothetical protein